MSQESGGSAKVSERWASALAVLFIGALALLLYAPKLDYPFVFDDMSVIARNQFVRDPANIKAIFSSRYFDEAKEMSFRPLVTLSYFLDAWAHGATSFGCNLQNLCWLILCGWLAFYLYRSFGFAASTAAAAVALFLVHPTTVEIAFAEGHREWLIFIAFALASWLSFVHGLKRGRGILPAASLLFWGLSLFAMELALVLPFVFAFFAWNFLRRDLKRVANLILPFLLVIAAYMVFLFRFSGREFGQIGDMWLGMSCSLELFYAYIRTALFPVKLSPAHDICYRAPSVVRLVASLVALLILGVLFLSAVRRRSLSATLLLWFVAPAVFLFQPIFPPPVGFGDRYLSFGLLGWTALITSLAHLFQKRRRRFFWGLLLFIAAALVAANTSYQRRWSSHVELWHHAVRNAPYSCIAQYNLGIAYMLEKNPLAARPYFLNVIGMCPSWGKAWSALGSIEEHKNRMRHAEVFYRFGLENDPRCRDCYRSLAYMKMRDHEFERAREMFEELLTDDPSDAASWRGLLSVARLMKDYRLAMRASAALLERTPPDLETALLWVDIYWANGKKNKAIAELIELIKWYPDHGERIMSSFERMKNR